MFLVLQEDCLDNQLIIIQIQILVSKIIYLVIFLHLNNQLIKIKELEIFHQEVHQHNQIQHNNLQEDCFLQIQHKLQEVDYFLNNPNNPNNLNKQEIYLAILNQQQLNNQLQQLHKLIYFLVVQDQVQHLQIQGLDYFNQIHFSIQIINQLLNHQQQDQED